MSAFPRKRMTLARSLAASGILALGLTGMLTSPAQAALPGEISSISGVLLDAAGEPVAGEQIYNYNYNHCALSGRVQLHSSQTSQTATTGPDGSFSFPAYPSQCYSLDVSGEIFRYQGVDSTKIFVPAGSTDVTLHQIAPAEVVVNTPGILDNTELSILTLVDAGGYKTWTATNGGLVQNGKVSIAGLAGSRQTVTIAQSGDYYSQVSGGATSPKVTDTVNTFIPSETASTTTFTASFKKSSPVKVNLTGFDVGAEVTASSLTAGFSGGSTGTETTTDPSGVTFHGLTPGLFMITVDGQFDGQPVHAEAFDIAVTQSASVVNVSLVGADYGADLVSSSTPLSVVSGALRIGGQLKASTTLQGSAAPFATAAGTEFHYYWIGGDYLALGGSWTILGTGPTLTIPSNFADNQLVYLITIVTAPGQEASGAGQSLVYVNSTLLDMMGGSSSVLTTGEILPAATPFPTTLPTITGAATIGSTLTAQPGTWSPTPTSFGYQWARNGQAIAGATAKTYKPTAADVGKTLTVTITPQLADHSIQSLTTTATAKVGKAKATVSAKLSKRSAKAGASVKVTVRVKATGVVPSGKVTIKYGSKKATGKIKNGKATVTLKKLKKGTYKVTTTYAGNTSIAQATAKKQTLKVK